MERRKFIFY